MGEGKTIRASKVIKSVPIMTLRVRFSLILRILLRKNANYKNKNQAKYFLLPQRFPSTTYFAVSIIGIVIRNISDGYAVYNVGEGEKTSNARSEYIEL